MKRKKNGLGNNLGTQSARERRKQLWKLRHSHKGKQRCEKYWLMEPKEELF